MIQFYAVKYHWFRLNRNPITLIPRNKKRSYPRDWDSKCLKK